MSFPSATWIENNCSSTQTECSYWLRRVLKMHPLSLLTTITGDYLRGDYRGKSDSSNSWVMKRMTCRSFMYQWFHADSQYPHHHPVVWVIYLTWIKLDIWAQKLNLARALWCRSIHVAHCWTYSSASLNMAVAYTSPCCASTGNRAAFVPSEPHTGPSLRFVLRLSLTDTHQYQGN